MYVVTTEMKLEPNSNKFTKKYGYGNLFLAGNKLPRKVTSTVFFDKFETLHEAVNFYFKTAILQDKHAFVKDSFGNYFSYEYLLQVYQWILANTHPRNNWYAHYYKQKNSFKFRQGAVTGIHKWKNKTDYRRPKTFKTLKLQQDIEDVEDISLTSALKVKITANSEYCPTSWDDIWREPQKNWKKQRKTKWKQSKPTVKNLKLNQD